MSQCFTPQQFSSFILTQLPVYSDEILRDIRPTDNLALHIDKAQWDPFAGVQQVQDRFRVVTANTGKAWEAITEESCAGAPCDPTENEICWGYDRLTFGQERQSWKSQLICFDRELSKTKAVEHFMQIITDVLRPATSAVNSMYVRKKALALAGNKILAATGLPTFTGSWETTGSEEVYYTPSALPTSKVTPELLKRQIPYLRNVGYFGKWSNDPFWGGYDQFAEFITDDDTNWELEKVASNTRVNDLWRFQQWSAAHEYFQYGFGGQIGNYMTRVDPFPLRFNRVGSTNKLQLVLPYKNSAATVGKGSEVNQDFLNAQYQISYIWHRFSWQMLVQSMAQINPLMPFMVRGLNGEWYFAMDNLGLDQNGQVISNYRRNKGFFWSDFRYGARPRYTEFLTAILHKREPAVFYTVDTCATDPGYPAQDYSSSCATCEGTLCFTPEQNSESHNYELGADSVMCDGNPVENLHISSASLAALVTALNNDPETGALGTWAVKSGSTTQIEITGATCAAIDLPWVGV